MILFHYTSLAAAINIVTTRTLWASSIHHLNDGTEFRIGYDLLRSEIDRIAPDDKRLAAFTDAVRFALVSTQQVNVFVGSFSENGDLLSQWRSYCPPGKGVSIGFDSADLAGSAVAQDFELVKCIYDPEEQHETVRTTLHAVTSNYQPTSNEDGGRPLLNAFQFIHEFVRVAARLKHPTFGEEQEWRVISGVGEWKHPQVTYREGRSTIVPYFEFKLPMAEDKLKTDSFILGPTPHTQLSMNSLLALIHARDVKTNILRPSGVPFRAW
jgi:Protein of unknown function (DUF2971).